MSRVRRWKKGERGITITSFHLRYVRYILNQQQTKTRRNGGGHRGGASGGVRGQGRDGGGNGGGGRGRGSDDVGKRWWT